MGYTKEERKRANDIANAYRAGVLSEGVIRAWLAVEQYVLDTHKPEYPKLIDPDDITEGMHVERRDALTDTHGVLREDRVRFVVMRTSAVEVFGAGSCALLKHPNGGSWSRSWWLVEPFDPDARQRSMLEGIVLKAVESGDPGAAVLRLLDEAGLTVEPKPVQP